ncbi:MAG: Uma2 family endonuclease [Anaerolineae bacterium]|nr:Uma2 family endonuclease [Anaerolineae bacterium]MDW8172313.1 Uma2 family endonuclease [Anaerolineae bacterium]
MTPEQFWRSYAFKPFELVRGQVVPLASLGFRYAIVALRVGMALEDQTEARGLGEVVRASCAFRLGVDTVRVPSVAYLSPEQLARHPYPYDYVPFAPLIVAEVFKQADDSPQVRELIVDYIRAGTQTLWGLFPNYDRLGVYRRGAVQYLRPGDTLREPLLPHLALPVAQLLPRRRLSRES